MSFSIIGKFFKKDGDNCKWVEFMNSDISFLKTLDLNRMSSSLLDMNGYIDKELPKEATYTYINNFYCYVYNTPENRMLLDENGFTKEVINSMDSYIKDGEIGDVLESIKLEDTSILLNMNINDISTQFIPIYYKGKYDLKGNWYSIDSFSSKKSEIALKYKDFNERYSKLKAIDSTVDFFKMTSEQKNDYYEEISFLEDTLEEYQYKMDACQNMIGILLSIEESFSESDNSSYEYKGIPSSAVYIYFD